MYRIFGIDLEHQRAWVAHVGEMVPGALAPGYTPRTPRGQRSRPDKPHLYRFWTDLSRLHSAVIQHSTGAGTCVHQLLRNGRLTGSAQPAR